jgi:hypothetical protein
VRCVCGDAPRLIAVFRVSAKSSICQACQFSQKLCLNSSGLPENASEFLLTMYSFESPWPRRGSKTPAPLRVREAGGKCRPSSGRWLAVVRTECADPMPVRQVDAFLIPEAGSISSLVETNVCKNTHALTADDLGPQRT